MRMTPPIVTTIAAAPADAGTAGHILSTQPVARVGEPGQSTAVHVRRHGRPRSHVRAVESIDHETLDAVLKGMDA